MLLVFLFLYAPILVLMVYSFNEAKTMGNWTGFSLKWYQALFADSTIMDALWVTLSVAVISALVATILGTFAAIGLHSMKKRRRALPFPGKTRRRFRSVKKVEVQEANLGFSTG
mgnify:CR=1 FL=1